MSDLGNASKLIINKLGAKTKASLDVVYGGAAALVALTARVLALETSIGSFVVGNLGGLKVKVIETGVWNMNATPTLNVPHVLTYANIRFVSASFLNDAKTLGHTMPANLTTSIDANVTWDGTNVILNRRTAASTFSSDTNYDDPAIVRGWVKIEYV
jgi:hypothetical protein